MARLARVVVPGLPHHVTQRGNVRSRVFFADADDALYRDRLARSCSDVGLAVLETLTDVLTSRKRPEGYRRSRPAGAK